MVNYGRMPNYGSVKSAVREVPVSLILSYAFDWIVLIIFAVVAGVLNIVTPNKRPFSLADRDLSFPHVDQAVPNWLLILLNAIVPIIIIAVVTILFVPGATVPRGTPTLLVWKRKLWELHVGWLGLALSLVTTWFFTNGMKQLFGKPRPDFLDRCQPNLANAADYTVGGFGGENALSQLYSAGICTQTDNDLLDEGFRSFPSGHASTAAAGLVYLSLFLAGKFAVTIPFVAAMYVSDDRSMRTAFPSRMGSTGDSLGPTNAHRTTPDGVANPSTTEKVSPHQHGHIQSLRRQAAAPPLYLLVIVLIPFATAVFIAASRWYDYRHHGFDILFGFIMGTVIAIYSFRYYHLAIREGAGWAWGPRSESRAFWAGVGQFGYAGEHNSTAHPAQQFHQGQAAGNGYAYQQGAQPSLTQRRNAPGQEVQRDEPFQEVDLRPVGDQPVHQRV